MAKCRAITQDQMIQVQYRLHKGDQRWRAALPVYPGDPYGSCTAVVEGREITVVFGWSAGEAVLWRSSGTELVTGDASGRLVDGNRLSVLAKLAEGPIELDGPKGRWRWRVVT
jgi:hypothetical protein